MLTNTPETMKLQRKRPIWALTLSNQVHCQFYLPLAAEDLGIYFSECCYVCLNLGQHRTSSCCLRGPSWLCSFKGPRAQFVCRWPWLTAHLTVQTLIGRCYSGSKVFQWIVPVTVAHRCYSGSQMLQWLTGVTVTHRCYSNSQVLQWLTGVTVAHRCYSGSQVLQWLTGSQVLQWITDISVDQRCYSGSQVLQWIKVL